MSDLFVAFDVETPNSFNSRMSSIGITIIEDGRIVDGFSSLVNPECSFDWFNVQLTGITPEMAEGAPCFSDLWPQMKPYFEKGLLLAHNAPFDMCVLARCLNGYGIHWRDTADYACTVRMSKYCFPELPNHKLDTLSSHFLINLDHHRADSDSRACAEIMLRCMERNVPLDRFRRTYDLKQYKTLSSCRKGSLQK